MKKISGALIITMSLFSCQKLSDSLYNSTGSSEAMQIICEEKRKAKKHYQVNAPSEAVRSVRTLRELSPELNRDWKTEPKLIKSL